MDLDTYQAYVAYLTKKSYPSGYTKTQKRTLRILIKSFFVQDNVLYHFRNRMYLNDPEKRKANGQKVVVGNVEKEAIIREAHSGLGGGHLGQKNTQKKVGERFWWPGFSNDVTEFVKTCDRCQKANPVHKPPPSELRPIPVTDQFGYRWCVDLIGPLTETARGNKYVAVATEYLSRFPVAKAIPNKTAECVGRFIFEDVICMFGVMKLLQHDQGREFCNELMEFIENHLDIKDVKSSAYHPQTNGLTERFNQSLETAFMKLGADDQENWDLKLQPALFAYRVSTQDSTKVTPYEMVFGCKARVPLDAGTLRDRAIDLDVNYEQAVADRMMVVSDKMIEIRAQGLLNLKKAQEKQKARYDFKHRAPAFQVGDKVLKKNRIRETTLHGGSRYLPSTPGQYYVITEILGPKVYRLFNPFTSTYLSGSVNGDNLKHYQEAAPSVCTDDDSGDQATSQVSTSNQPAASLPRSQAQSSGRLLHPSVKLPQSSSIQEQPTSDGAIEHAKNSRMENAIRLVSRKGSWLTRAVILKGIENLQAIDPDFLNFEIGKLVDSIYENAKWYNEVSVEVGDCVRKYVVQAEGNFCTIFEALAHDLNLSVDEIRLFDDDDRVFPDQQISDVYEAGKNLKFERVNPRRSPPESPETVKRKSKYRTMVDKNLLLAESMKSKASQELATKLLKGTVISARNILFSQWWHEGSREFGREPFTLGPFIANEYLNEDDDIVTDLLLFYQEISRSIGGSNPVVERDQVFTLCNGFRLLPPSTEKFIKCVVFFECMKHALIARYQLTEVIAESIVCGQNNDLYAELVERNDSLDEGNDIEIITPSSPALHVEVADAQKVLPEQSCDRIATNVQPELPVLRENPAAGRSVEQCQDIRKSVRLLSRSAPKESVREKIVGFRSASEIVGMPEERNSWPCTVCNVPWSDDGPPMICCDICERWTHWGCVGLKRKPSSSKWVCPGCKKK